MKKKPARLKDIAERLGVSPATVSKALRNRLEIGEETTRKVKAIAKEMRYQPNFMAAHLRSQRKFSIGVIVPRVVHQYMSTIVGGILAEANRHNYQVIICVTDHVYEREVKAIEQLAAGLVDGLLICVSNHTKDFAHLEQLKQDGMPFVLYDKDIARIEAPKVIVDDYSGAVKAVEHLILQGYRHIAHLQDNLVNHSSQKRMKGYFSALKKHGIAKDLNLIVQLDEISVESSRRATENLLKVYPQIDAVFGITDEIAVGALQAAQQAGRIVPQEFGVVGFSNWLISSVTTPTLTTVNQPGKEMGEVAIRLLIQQIETPDLYTDSFPTKTLKTQLIVRESSFRKMTSHPTTDFTKQ